MSNNKLFNEFVELQNLLETCEEVHWDKVALEHQNMRVLKVQVSVNQKGQDQCMVFGHSQKSIRTPILHSS